MSLPTTVSVGATSGPNASIARPAWIAVGCATLGFVLLGALLFPSAGWDDAYITYWSAYSLADLGRLANINHDFIEQSSSLAFVVALAALRRLSGVDPSILGRVASVAFGVVCIGATALLGNRARTGVAWAAAILVGSATYFVYWAFGGMESTLDACAGVLLLLLTARALDDGMDAGWAVLTFIAVSVYLVARPESIFVLVATLAGLGAATWFRRMRGVEGQPWEARAPRVTLALAVLCLIAAALMVTFRLWYFGALFPEPVYAKAGGLSPSRIVEGLRYVQANIQSDFILLFGVAALASVAVLLSGTPAWTWSSVEGVCAPFFLAHLGFIVLAGGDGMHGGRFFVPVIPAAAVLCAGFLTRLLTPRTFRALIVVWAAVQLGGAVAFARTQSHSDPLWAVDAAGGDDAEGRFHWFERANHDHRRYFAAATQLEAEVDRVMAPSEAHLDSERAERLRHVSPGAEPPERGQVSRSIRADHARLPRLSCVGRRAAVVVGIEGYDRALPAAQGRLPARVRHRNARHHLRDLHG